MKGRGEVMKINSTLLLFGIGRNIRLAQDKNDSQFILVLFQSAANVGSMGSKLHTVDKSDLTTPSAGPLKLHSLENLRIIE